MRPKYYLRYIKTFSKISPHRLDTFLTGSLGSTLNQVYRGSNSRGYLLWNGNSLFINTFEYPYNSFLDQSPDGQSPSSKAHAKGVLGFDSAGGFFLRHSVPRFPEYVKNGYSGYPAFAKTYGQSFLCISLNIKEVDTFATQFLINEPFVYDSYVPAEIATKHNNIKDLADGKKSQTTQRQVTIKSVGGQQFIDIAKSKKCECDLFDTLISNGLNTDLKVLSWGRPYMPSKCKPSHNHNIHNIVGISWGALSYTSNKEHSKWAYSPSSDVVCIGDINRMESQKKRGGGATCFKNYGLWNTYKTITTSVEPC